MNSSELATLKGYHVTSSESAVGIKAIGFRKSTGDKQWLGEGVYFFEANDKCSAIKLCNIFAASYKKINNSVILSSEIAVSVEKFLDLAENKNHQKLFEQIFSDVENRLTRSQIQLKKYELDKAYKMSLAKIRENIKVIRAIMDFSPVTHKMFNRVLFNPHIQICVIDSQCILRPTILEVHDE